MEYEKYIKRLVLGYLKKECKHTYKVFLKYNFHSQNKHIATRVAGQTLEDILRIYSRVEEIVQGHLEDTNYYKERSVEFSSPIYLNDQLLYLLEKDRPFTPASTPCPRSPAESVVESHHEDDACPNHISDVDTTPEHTLPGNISSHDSNYQSKIPCRREFKSPSGTTPHLERMSTSDKEPISEVMSINIPEKSESQKKLASNINIGLNTPEIPCVSHRGENEKNKEGVGTELEYMFHDFLGTPVSNTISKAVESTSASSSHFIHGATPSRNWQHIDDHNNRAVSSILAAANNTPSKCLATANDNTVYDDNVNNFREPPISTTIQTAPMSTTMQTAPMSTTMQTAPMSTTIQAAPMPTSYTNSQYLLPASMGMYIVPQPTASTMQSGNQQQIYIVNQPMVMPQQAPMMQVLQSIAPAEKSNKKPPLCNDDMYLEQDIMSMPTIILNERNEVTHADPGNFSGRTPFKDNEAHNLKEYLNLFGASDQSPTLKLSSTKKAIKYQPPIRPTTTIKVEVFKRDTVLPNAAKENEAAGPSNGNNSQSVSEQINTGVVDSTSLPNLNETMESEPVKIINVEPTNINKEFFDTDTNDTKVGSHDKIKSRMVAAVTPSPLKTTVRKPTPKSGSHVRNLTFPSPIRKTSEKPESTRSSPRIINKQQAAKDLFGNEDHDEIISNATERKVEKSTKTSRTPKSSERNLKKSIKKGCKSPKKSCKSPKKSCKSPKKVTGKDKTKSSKKNTKKEAIKENTIEDEDITPKCCWDSNLRKLIPPIIEINNSTPVRRISARSKARQSTELDTTDLDGKKLEEALKTPDTSQKSKRKTPAKKKKIATLNNKNEKLEENVETQDGQTKSGTKVLSPSKLNANKRNILLNDIDDVTPSTLKESSQYPISSKTRRNISSLLETPIKEDLVPPTPGTVPDKNDTPFTPMLRANLKDFTEGDTFSINTPNFPITPGFSALVNTSAAYYILNDNEHNKETEATVLREEKKSSVRKSDDEEVEVSPRVYGSKDILEDFNKSRIGKKNLELLDNRGVTWDGSSDKEEKSADNSENNSDDESNNTVIQNQAVKPHSEMKVFPKRSKTSGKCMVSLHSQLLKEIHDPSERFTHASESNNQESLNANPKKDEEGNGGEQANKLTKSSSSGSESEVLSKKNYAMKKNNQSKKDIPITTADFDEKSEPNSGRINATDKCNTPQEIRRAISDVCVENILDRDANFSLKAQLDEKKRRWIELDKAKKPSYLRKTPSRRPVLKPPSNLNPVRSKRKAPSPRKVVKNIESNKRSNVPEDKNDNNKKHSSTMKENVEIKKRLEREVENADVDSQDEFFKRSGTNLHRTNKGNVQSTKDDTDTVMDGDNEPHKAKTESSTDKICRKDNKLRIQQHSSIEKYQDDQKSLKETEVDRSDRQKVPEVPTGGVSTESDNPDEFEKSWEDCRISETQTIYDEDCRHDDSKPPNKKLEDYDFSILQKKIILGVPCSDGSTVNIKLTCTTFDTLLEYKASGECETLDGGKDEVDSSLDLELKLDAVSDTENAGCKTDNPDPKCAKKRKYRSDSCNSNSSTKRIKKNEIFNEMNIQKVLTKIHGPGPSKR